MITKLQTVHYSRNSDHYTTETIEHPDWDTVLAELQSMDPFEKPILSLFQHTDTHDSEVMMINGGKDLFHIQISDSDGNWLRAFDPSGTDEIVDIWTSDQGFSCERKFAWSLETASLLVEYYFEYAKQHPDFQWE